LKLLPEVERTEKEQTLNPSTIFPNLTWLLLFLPLQIVYIDR